MHVPRPPFRRFPAHVAAALLAAASGAPPGAQVLTVESVEPARNALHVRTATSLVIDFDAAVNAASVAAAVQVFGRWSGVASIEVEVDGDVVELVPTRPFFPGEPVTVALSSGVTSAGGDPLEGGFTWYFFTGSTQSTGDFSLVDVLDVRLSGEGLVQSYGIYAGDLDRDGAPDFSIPNEVASDVRVMTSDGCAVFSEPVPYALPADAVPSANEGQDFDGDGFIDLVTANIFGDQISVLLGDGSGGYQSPESYDSGNQPRGVAVLDADADGHYDVVAVHRTSSDVRLHLNQGDGTFVAEPPFDGGGNAETSVVSVDADGDGRVDLFVGHLDSQSVSCLLGDGNAGFTVNATTGIGGSPWMLAAGDVDADGAVDVASCNFNTDTAGIVRGDGSGGLHPVQTYAAGDFPLAVDLGDLNGDGYLDLLISNYSAATWSLYRNHGDGTFAAPESLFASQAGSCATLVDYDRDGDMDIVGVDEVSDEVFLYRQDSVQSAGTQLAQCAATLRIANLAGAGGFGSPAHEVELGGRLHLGISSGGGRTFAFVFGNAFTPALPITAGLLSVFPPTLEPGGVTDAKGEGLTTLKVGAGLPPGFSLVFQGVVVDPTVTGGALLTNPETILLVP